MSVAVSKTVYLVFDARAVARTLAMNAAAEHWAILKAAAQNVVRFQVCTGNPTNAIITDKLVRWFSPEIICIAARNGFCQMAVAHGPRCIVATLHVAFVKVDGIGIQAARRTRLKATERYSFASKAFRQLVCTRFADSPTKARFEPGEHFRSEEGATRNHKRTSHVAFAI